MCAGQGAPVGRAAEALVFAEASDLMDELARLGLSDCFQRAARSTACAQPAIFCVTVAKARRHLQFGMPQFAAGHSLGEYSALVTAGALDALTGLRLVVRRGSLMQKAVRSCLPSGMLAVRASASDVAEVLRDLPALTIANDNGPRQVVIAGELRALDKAAKKLRALRMHHTRLMVSGAFHHPIMTPALACMASALREVEFGNPLFTVMSGLTARPFENIPEELLAGIITRVRWRETMRWLLDAGATRFVDLGPGHALARLARESVEGDPRIEVI
jgi:malonyl CoA-acyl carrier protein transacylase